MGRHLAGWSRDITFIVLAALTVAGCGVAKSSPATPVPSSTPSLGVQDASYLFYGSCIEAMMALDGQQLILEDAVSLDLFYNLLDNYCETAIPRGSIDFSQQMLVIAAKVVQACDASLTLAAIQGELLTLRLAQQGDCNYEVFAGYFGLLPRAVGVRQVTISS